MNTSYKEKLQRQFLRSTLIPLVMSLLVFLLLLIGVLYSYTYLNLNRWSRQASEKVQSIYTYCCDYLTDVTTQGFMAAYIAGEVSDGQMTQFVRTASYDAPVELDMLLLDMGGSTLYFSGEENDYSSFLVYYYQLLGETSDGSLVSRVYRYKQTGTTKWLLSCTLANASGGELGQMILMIDETALAAAFQGTGYEVVLTNSSNLAAMSTAQKLLDSRHFFPCEGRFFSAGGTEFAVKQLAAPELDGYVYTLCAMQNWTHYYVVGLATLLLAAVILLVQSRKFAHRLAEDNSRALEELHSELAMVQIDPEHQISTTSDDEFGDIARRINLMLDDVKKLNAENLELERRRSDLEKAQLKSCFHPHFIYNTIESVRFAILMNDNQQASRVLMKLTTLLRYSVDNTVSLISMEEDMEHIREYIEIMQFRFGERFTYSMDIGEETKSCLVPPLLVQPLVENSTKYGFNGTESIHVAIRSWCQDGYLHITVADNGAGMTDEQLARQQQYLAEGQGNRSHFGISLVDKYLRSQYGAESALLLSRPPEGGLCVELKLKEVRSL